MFQYKLAGLIFDITTDQKFDIVIMVIIILNMLTMMFEYYGMSTQMKDILAIFNLIFITVFTAECVLKLFGLRWYYFKVPWNVFDFVVVVLSILGKLHVHFCIYILLCNHQSCHTSPSVISCINKCHVMHHSSCFALFKVFFFHTINGSRKLILTIII